MARPSSEAEVGVAEAERPIVVGVLRDFGGRIGREVDQDFLRHEEDADCVAIALDVERSVLGEELGEIERRQIARRIIEEHIFGARVRRIDRSGVRASVPAVDRAVVLHARIGAPPRGLGQQVPQLFGVQCFDDFAGGARVRLPHSARERGTHELVGDPDGVVRILSTDRVVGVTVEVGGVARLDEGLRFLLFAYFPGDEVDDLGVVHVEADHLRRSARGPTRLGRTRRAVEYFEEAHETRARAAPR